MNKSLYSKQKKMTLSFERFVPLQFLQYLNRQQIEDVALGDQTQRDMTILFSDIRSYTSISEKMSPKENFEFINKYLEFMAPNILENHGFIDKFIGDAIMALFPLSADDALSAAIKLTSSLKFFNEAWVQGGGDPINMGIGIHTGLLTLGTVGYKDRMETTVISDAVNLASRIEGLTKKYGCRILISGKTLESLSNINNIQLRQVDSVLVKGKHEPCDLFDIFNGEDMHSLDLKKGTLFDFNKAFTNYKNGFFSEAEKIFDRVLTLNPDDKAALILRNRCVKFLKIGVPKDWNGVVDYDYE
jgi:two-component system sensor histidine kinase ChiS